MAADSASGNLHRRYGRTLYLQKKEKQIRKPNKETKINGYDWELLCEAPFFIQKNHRKEQKTMMKAMEKRQEARKNQEKTLKRMMAYQKKAEQMVSRKRMNHHMIRKG